MNKKKSIFTSNQIAIILVLLLFLTFDCDIVDNQRNIPELKYDDVQIGSQVWMDRNLYETNYRNGDPIPLVTDREEWKSIKTGAYCYYDNDETNIETYGLLYNWYAVADTRNIAPEGWHIASYDEWKKLLEYLGDEEIEDNDLNYSGIEIWICPKCNTPENGFSALPGGRRQYSDESNHYIYVDIGILACFWTNSISDMYLIESLSMWLYCDTSKVFNPFNGDSGTGYSVRCIKDTYDWPVKSESQDEKSLILLK